jgi:hypothetical protein
VFEMDMTEVPTWFPMLIGAGMLLFVILACFLIRHLTREPGGS